MWVDQSGWAETPVTRSTLLNMTPSQSVKRPTPRVPFSRHTEPKEGTFLPTGRRRDPQPFVARLTVTVDDSCRSGLDVTRTVLSQW